MFRIKLIGFLLIAGYFLYCLATPGSWHFINWISLVIHEAGHSIFIFFGEYIHVLSGSVFQLVIPAIFAFYFFLRSEVVSGAVVLFWLGQSFTNVSIYIGDALKMQLDLLGGDGVIHDWNYLLSEIGLLSYTDTIAGTAYVVGFAIFLYALILGLRTLFSPNNNFVVQ
jgi:hypothetical protein